MYRIIRYVLGNCCTWLVFVLHACALLSFALHDFRSKKITVGPIVQSYFVSVPYLIRCLSDWWMLASLMAFSTMYNGLLVAPISFIILFPSHIYDFRAFLFRIAIPAYSVIFYDAYFLLGIITWPTRFRCIYEYFRTKFVERLLR